MFDCYENIKKNSDLQLHIKTMTLEKFLTAKKKKKKEKLKSLTASCKLLHLCCFIYWAVPSNILLFLAKQINFMVFYMSRMYIRKTSWD